MFARIYNLFNPQPQPQQSPIIRIRDKIEQAIKHNIEHNKSNGTLSDPKIGFPLLSLLIFGGMFLYLESQEKQQELNAITYSNGEDTCAAPYWTTNRPFEDLLYFGSLFIATISLLASTYFTFKQEKYLPQLRLGGALDNPEITQLRNFMDSNSTIRSPAVFQDDGSLPPTQINANTLLIVILAELDETIRTQEKSRDLSISLNL